MSKNPDLRPASYLNRWTADPGDRVQIMATGGGAATATLVRLRGLTGERLPTGYREDVIGRPVPLELAARTVPAGSCARTAHGPVVTRDATWCWSLKIFPTLTDRGTVLAWGDDGPRLAMRDGRIEAVWGGASVAVPIDPRGWTEVAMRFAPGAGMTLEVMPTGPGAWHRSARRARCDAAGGAVAGPLIFGHGFNGKIDGPALAIGGECVARWDFAADMTRQRVPGQGSHGRALALINAPRRAVTSSAWNGAVHDWTIRPDQYAAIHFHDDDLADCLWPVDLELTVPDDAASGIYAIRLESPDGVRHAPVFVRARRRARIAFLASTLSYLAYGNSIWDSRRGTEWERRNLDEATQAERFGRSMYCRHRDGTGIGLVSMRRPILSFTPGFVGEAIGGQVLLNDDLRILAWLDRVGEPYDIVTDHDLHERGTSALSGYDVLVTGVHPEYHSHETLNAIEAFAMRGGRLMYMGGNGFYWRVSTLPDAPHVMEVRRAEGGIRTWEEVPNEYVHQSDGMLGGMWRRLGRPPNRLVGVGYSAQGSEEHTRGYVATAASRDPRAAFLFEGVTGPVIGAAGSLGASVGYEVDRADPALGTPPHALVVARSQPFEGEMSPVNEERLTDVLLTAEDPLRADMVFYEGPCGGAVFSASSVLFAGGLNEVGGAERLASNALRRFADTRPFELPGNGEGAAIDV